MKFSLKKDYSINDFSKYCSYFMIFFKYFGLTTISLKSIISKDTSLFPIFTLIQFAIFIIQITCLIYYWRIFFESTFNPGSFVYLLQTLSVFGTQFVILCETILTRNYQKCFWSKIFYIFKVFKNSKLNDFNKNLWKPVLVKFVIYLLIFITGEILIVINQTYHARYVYFWCLLIFSIINGRM